MSGANKSFALGQQGHQIVCQLAFNNLNHRQQQSLQNWVAQISPRHKSQINHRLHRDKNATLTFSDACVWADAIRHIDTYKPFSTWHYVNVERDDLRATGFGCPRGCIIQAMITHDQQWRENRPVTDRLEALLFLSHWFGDIHQPLHVSFQSDRGGNDTLVIDSANKCTNLHQVWDTCLVRDIAMTDQQWQIRFVDYQKSQNLEFIDQLRLPTVVSWANESLFITRNPRLQYCHTQGGNWCYPVAGDIFYNRHYIEQNKHLLQQQILLSALRLRAYLAATL
ncbi:S1/P1 nuclease [Thalassotalea litorea]|nr:S1/P1 nuclease [Thalassotalea litorea]